MFVGALYELCSVSFPLESLVLLVPLISHFSEANDPDKRNISCTNGSALSDFLHLNVCVGRSHTVALGLIIIGTQGLGSAIFRPHKLSPDSFLLSSPPLLIPARVALFSNTNKYAGIAFRDTGDKAASGGCSDAADSGSSHTEPGKALTFSCGRHAFRIQGVFCILPHHAPASAEVQ